MNPSCKGLNRIEIKHECKQDSNRIAMWPNSLCALLSRIRMPLEFWMSVSGGVVVFRTCAHTTIHSSMWLHQNGVDLIHVMSAHLSSWEFIRETFHEGPQSLICLPSMNKHFVLGVKGQQSHSNTQKLCFNYQKLLNSEIFSRHTLRKRGNPFP